ncbi:hypothetical protein ACSMXN_00225 [Jatrophihabitans sp. DSM 45814]
MSDYVDLGVLRNVVVIALIAGVGVTGLFALGSRWLDEADQAVASGANSTRARALGWTALGLVAGLVIVGIWAVLAK